MSEKTYWRGFVDAQCKTIEDNIPVVVSRNEKELLPLAKILDTKVESYRSGYRIQLPHLDKKLPKPKKQDYDYACGFFDSCGKTYQKPFKITITSLNLEPFTDAVMYFLGESLPKPTRPNNSSQSQRIIVTGAKAQKLKQWLNDE